MACACFRKEWHTAPLAQACEDIVSGLTTSAMRRFLSPTFKRTFTTSRLQHSSCLVESSASFGWYPTVVTRFETTRFSFPTGTVALPLVSASGVNSRYNTSSRCFCSDSHGWCWPRCKVPPKGAIRIRPSAGARDALTNYLAFYKSRTHRKFFGLFKSKSNQITDCYSSED